MPLHAPNRQTQKDRRRPVTAQRRETEIRTPQLLRKTRLSKKSVCAAAVEKMLPRSVIGVCLKRLPIAAAVPPNRSPIAAMYA
jgi:hypothetical protein